MGTPFLNYLVKFCNDIIFKKFGHASSALFVFKTKFDSEEIFFKDFCNNKSMMAKISQKRACLNEKLDVITLKFNKNKQFNIFYAEEKKKDCDSLLNSYL